ncbi:MAG: hypothetical protein AAB606_01320 [Patescibacteria group bacterium]
MNKEDYSIKPAYLKGFLWVAFSGTATLCAILLPVHIFAILMGSDAKLGNNFYGRTYIFILISCALFHSLYRVNTILIDLGLAKYQKTAGVLLSLLFVVFEVVAVYTFFF